LTASSPKQRIAWCRKLAVDDLSLESWNWWTPPSVVLHFQATHGQKWHSQLSWYWIETLSVLKKVYIGERQVFLRASRDKGIED
jgi:hypothetical protein